MIRRGGEARDLEKAYGGSIGRGIVGFQRSIPFSDRRPLGFPRAFLGFMRVSLGF